MADDIDRSTQPGEQADATSQNVETESPQPDVTTSEEPLAEAPGEDPVARIGRAVRTLNRSVPGTLVLHYEARDVTLVVDGDAAIRIMTMFAQRAERGLGDRLSPTESTALTGWVVLDVNQPLAMSWMPGLPARAPRTAIDPVLASA